MKRLLNIVFLFSQATLAQINLVPNPSFEQYTNCPTTPGQISYATEWFQPYAWMGSVASGSTDYFNACATGISGVSVPNNYLGTKIANSGSAYSGIICFAPDTLNYREYIEVKLFSPMVKNQKYCVEFYVSLSDDSKFSIDAIGAYFSNDTLINDHSGSVTMPFLIQNSPQISNPIGNLIANKTDWTKISGTYNANGGEQFITIGNFFDSTSINIQSEIGSSLWAYYYIDDVSVIECNDSYIPNVFTPNNDGINDFFEIKNLPENASTQIFNRWGIKVFETTKSDIFWDGRTTSGIESVDGTYFYIITTEEKTYKGFLQLIH